MILKEKEAINLKAEEDWSISKEDSWEVLEGGKERREIDRILYQLEYIKRNNMASVRTNRNKFNEKLAKKIFFPNFHL